MDGEEEQSYGLIVEVGALAREFGISRDTLYRYVPVKKRRAR